ncbi:MAG: bacteriohemerythrin [Colwellia sp.]|nr:bacteriohemerythrin [Colwellia sp.]
MKYNNIQKNVDVLVIYQDRKVVENSIQQIQALDLKLHCLVFDTGRISSIISLKPKIILLSSNNIISTIRFYIELLEKYGKDIPIHKVILLIKNKESTRAYKACETGLFDNYVVINPLNEPFRLTLVLLHTLKLIEDTKNDKCDKLLADGEDELAACISQGLALKNTFKTEMSTFKESIVEVTKSTSLNDKDNTLITDVIDKTFQELKQNVSLQIQASLDKMIDLKSIQNQLSTTLSKPNLVNEFDHKLANVDKSALLSEYDTEEPEQQASTTYKLLIAENSKIFIQTLTEIFDDTKFRYIISTNGSDAFLQFKEYKPDVILLSYDLPEMNGVELTKRIRATGSKVPIVALSKKNDKKVIKSWVALGLSSYLLKPPEKSKVINAVEKAVNTPIEILFTEKDSNKIKWITEYSVGNKLIDTQHKILFTLINDFFMDDKKETVKLTFEKLSKYIKSHFESEEELLKEINYPKRSSHIQKHRALANKFEQIKQNLSTYDSEEHDKIALFLYRWLANHILKEDLDYKSYVLNQKNVNI